RARDLGVAQPAADGERLELEPAHGGMVFVVATRRALEHLLLAQAAEALLQLRLQHELLERLRIARDRDPELVERGARWHPAAAAEHRGAGLQVEVEAGAAAVRLAAHLGRAPHVEE